MRIFVVVPVFNEEKNLSKFLGELVGVKHDVVVVDDGSTDKTAQIAQSFNLHFLRYPVNIGKGSAMRTGAEYAFSKGADWVIFMDGDGQHKVEDIKNFKKEMAKGADVLIGIRNFGKNAPKDRLAGNRLASKLVHLLFGINKSDLLCGFRAVNKKGFEQVYWKSDRYGVETEMVVRLAKNKVKYKEVEVKGVYLDNVKGVTAFDAMEIFFDLLKWRLSK